MVVVIMHGSEGEVPGSRGGREGRKEAIFFGAYNNAAFSLVGDAAATTVFRDVSPFLTPFWPALRLLWRVYSPERVLVSARTTPKGWGGASKPKHVAETQEFCSVFRLSPSPAQPSCCLLVRFIA